MDDGVKALLSHTVRDAIYDVRPNANKLRVKPYMYWNPKKKTSCIKMLLKRSPSIQVLADKFPKNQFARLYAEYVRTQSNNERSMQKRQVKLIFTDADSDFAMIKHVPDSEGRGPDQEIRLSTALAGEFENVQDLRNAIASGSMYTHPALFDLFCAGLESGRLRSTKKMDVSPIEQIITVGHEAHFRLELWYCVRGFKHSHDSSKKNIEERHIKFAEFCRYVIADRHDNAAAAFVTRTASGPPIVDDAASSSDDDDGCAEDYW